MKCLVKVYILLAIILALSPAVFAQHQQMIIYFPSGPSSQAAKQLMEV